MIEKATVKDVFYAQHIYRDDKIDEPLFVKFTAYYEINAEEGDG